MVFCGTRINIFDNSGVKQIKCIRRVNKKQNYHLGNTFGDLLLCSVLKMKHYRRIKKVDLESAVLITMARRFKRANGFWFKFAQNRAVFLKKNLDPLGTKIKSILPSEILKNYKFRIFLKGHKFI